MKIGIVQMPMQWTTEENSATICQYIAQHEDLDYLVFPELSLSGFHRNIIAQSDKYTVDNAINLVAQACRKYQVNAFIGAPVTVESAIYNSYLAISAEGKCLTRWDKVGLTPSEARIFSAGTARNIIKLGSSYVTSFMCREADDHEWLISTVGHAPLNFILWPSYICHGDGEGSDDGTIQSGYFAGASSIARNLQSVVIQCNWPCSVNDAGIKGMGGSRIYGSDGETLYTMPRDEVAVGVFDLNEKTFAVRV